MANVYRSLKQQAARLSEDAVSVSCRFDPWSAAPLVSAMWLPALLWLHVPWAVFWALVAGGLQWLPHFGPVMALFGPAMSMLFSGASWTQWLCLLGAYSVIAK